MWRLRIESPRSIRKSTWKRSNMSPMQQPHWEPQTNTLEIGAKFRHKNPWDVWADSTSLIYQTLESPPQPPAQIHTALIHTCHYHAGKSWSNPTRHRNSTSGDWNHTTPDFLRPEKWVRVGTDKGTTCFSKFRLSFGFGSLPSLSYFMLFLYVCVRTFECMCPLRPEVRISYSIGAGSWTGLLCKSSKRL